MVFQFEMLSLFQVEGSAVINDIIPLHCAICPTEQQTPSSESKMNQNNSGKKIAMIFLNLIWKDFLCQFKR